MHNSDAQARRRIAGNLPVGVVDRTLIMICGDVCETSVWGGKGPEIGVTPKECPPPWRSSNFVNTEDGPCMRIVTGEQGKTE